MELIVYARPPSVQDLCLYLGIDKSTWNNYSGEPEFSDICAEAKLRIEAYLIQEVNTRDRPQGVMFNLENNFDWKKKKEVELGDKTTTAISAASLPMEEKEKILKSIVNCFPAGELSDADNDE